MLPAAHGGAQLFNGLITLVILVLIVRRTLTTQTVRVWALIAVPLIVLAAAASFVVATPPSSAMGDLALVIGALAGAALGYARGIHTKAALGPRPGTLVVQGNVVLVAILVAAFAARFVLRTVTAAHGPLSVALSDAFLVFAAFSVAVARGMLVIAWRQLTRAKSTLTSVA